MTADEVERALNEGTLQLLIQGMWHTVRRCNGSKVKRNRRNGRFDVTVECAAFGKKPYPVNETTLSSEIRDTRNLHR